MKNRPTISVIIPTKNRTNDLELTIKSLLEQTRRPDELVLVDQSFEKSFTQQIPIPLRYIHDQGITGLTAARNSAMKSATGDIWLFLDDDVVLEPDFIEEILAAYQPGIAGVSGIITNYHRPPLGHLIWETVFMRGPFHDDRQCVYWNSGRMKDRPPIRVRQMGGGLMSFRADAIRGLRFDTNLTDACPGEDIEFCANLPKESVFLITPRARLVHNRSPEGRASKHWLLVHTQVSYYMRERHSRGGLWNNLCFQWLKMGYALAAGLSSLKRLSLEPWQAWQSGARRGLELANGKMSGN
jgi:glycosyltransferase involved in cell wall biosynthesis